jgi:hypothetical protein
MLPAQNHSAARRASKYNLVILGGTRRAGAADAVADKIGLAQHQHSIGAICPGREACAWQAEDAGQESQGQDEAKEQVCFFEFHRQVLSVRRMIVIDKAEETGFFEKTRFLYYSYRFNKGRYSWLFRLLITWMVKVSVV